MFIEKPTVFLYGGCELDDAILSCKDLIRNYNFSQRSLSSLFSLYSPAGDISNKFYHWFRLQSNEFKKELLPVCSDIVKSPCWIKDIIKNSKKDDVLIVNFSNELFTKFIYKKECITVNSHLINYLKHIPYSLTSILTDPNNHLYFDEDKNIDIARELLEEFIKDIAPIFKERVILVNTIISNKAYIDINNFNYSELMPSDFLPWYKRNKDQNSVPTLDIENSYAQRCLNLIKNRFLKLYPYKIQEIKLLREDYFIDLDHRWGFSPVHYHKITNVKLGYAIKNGIENVYKKELFENS